MVRIIMEMVGNCRFTFTTGNGKRRSYNASRTVSHRALT